MNPAAAPAGSGGRSRSEILLRGEPAAPGIAVARTVLFERLAVPVFRLAIRRGEVPREIARFEEARERSVHQLREIRENTDRALGSDHAYLFEAQRLMLEDALLVDRVREIIGAERVNAEWAVRTVLRELEAVFVGLADDYLRQRKGDIADVGARLLGNLAGGWRPVLARQEEKHVLAAEDVRPSDTAEMDWGKTSALVMEAGGPTYHTAILARTHDVPCVTGVRGLMRHIRAGLPLVVDGSEGIVIVNPTPQTVRAYHRKRNRQEERRRELLAAAAPRCVTADGEPVVLMANVDEPGEIGLVRQNGAAGVGLFRTERLVNDEIPSEEQQFRVYRDLAAAVHPEPLVIRAFDLDATSIGRAREHNPALGLRGTRLLIQASAIFETQIRAVLRAAANTNVQLMFPMIGGVEEFGAARTHVRAAVRSLRQRGASFREVPVGAMLEVPSAAATVDLLVKEAEFLSIGTNDLMQYLFGADRANERVARLNDPFHPALLRTMRFVTRATKRSGVPLAVCGEVAAEPLVIPLLLGFGVRTFSMSANALPEVKRIISGVRIDAAEELARQSVRLGTARRVRGAPAALPQALHRHEAGRRDELTRGTGPGDRAGGGREAGVSGSRGWGGRAVFRVRRGFPGGTGTPPTGGRRRLATPSARSHRAGTGCAPAAGTVRRHPARG